MAGIHKEFKCSTEDLENKKKTPFIPQPHQIKAQEFFINGVKNNGKKGILLYHTVGSGKTCTSIMIADTMLKKGLITKVYVFSPGSLRPGWKEEYCTVCGNNNLFENFVFITYNYDVRKELKKINFSKSLVIIDEVHNLINGVKNDCSNLKLHNDYELKNDNKTQTSTKVAVSIYNKIHNEPNCYIIALSGTPIYKNIYEWPLLCMLLDPTNKLFSEVVDKTTLKNTGSKFMEDFDTNENSTIFPKDPLRYSKIIKNIVSFYCPTGEDYPTVIEEEPIQARMWPEQNNNYWLVASKEEKIRNQGYPKKSRNESAENFKKKIDRYIMATQYIMSRHASNCYYPNELLKLKDVNVKHKGWISSEKLKNKLLLKMSSKITALVLNIIYKKKSKHAIYTFAKTKSGVELISSLLNLVNIKCLIFSGDTSSKNRTEILNKFNSVDNRYGKNYPVILLTSAGAEGITLKEVQHMHILETSHRPNLTKQAIGRAVRFKSHSNMPVNERVVHIWRYWSIPTTNNSKTTVLSKKYNASTSEIEEKKKEVSSLETVDESLYKSGLKELNQIDSFLKFIQGTSIESNNKLVNEKTATLYLKTIKKSVNSMKNPENTPDRPPVLNIENYDYDKILDISVLSDIKDYENKVKKDVNKEEKSE